MTLITATISTMLGKEVALILEVQQRPVVMVAAEIDASSTSAVATVRTAVRLVLYVAQVHGALCHPYQSGIVSLRSLRNWIQPFLYYNVIQVSQVQKLKELKELAPLTS